MLRPRRTPTASTRGLAPGRGRRSLASPIPHPKRAPAPGGRSGRSRSLFSRIGFFPTSQLASSHSSCVLLLRPPWGIQAIPIHDIYRGAVLLLGVHRRGTGSLLELTPFVLSGRS